MHHTEGFELATKQISLHFGAFAVLGREMAAFWYCLLHRKCEANMCKVIASEAVKAGTLS